MTIVRMRYSGSLGATVWQTYELKRGAGPKGPFAFRDLQRYIEPSVPGSEPIIT